MLLYATIMMNKDEYIKRSNSEFTHSHELWLMNAIFQFSNMSPPLLAFF